MTFSYKGLLYNSESGLNRKGRTPKQQDAQDKKDGVTWSLGSGRRKQKITSKQKAARQKNIKKARAAKRR